MALISTFHRDGDRVRVRAVTIRSGHVLVGLDNHTGDQTGEYFDSIADALATLDARRDALLRVRDGHEDRVYIDVVLGAAAPKAVA